MTWLTVVGLLLAACANSKFVETVVDDASHIHRVVGTAEQVTVTNVHDPPRALPFAEQYCESLGRTAKFNRMVRYRYHRKLSESVEFDCLVAAVPHPL